jgi:hypothetical protein
MDASDGDDDLRARVLALSIADHCGVIALRMRSAM